MVTPLKKRFPAFPWRKTMKSLSTVIAMAGNRTRDRPDAMYDKVHVFLKKKFNMYYISNSVCTAQ